MTACCRSSSVWRFSSAASWRAAISSRARRLASIRNVRVARQHGARDVPGDAHDHLVARSGLREFRDQRVAVIVPPARYSSLLPDPGPGSLERSDGTCRVIGKGLPKSEDVPLGPTLPEPAGVPGRVRFERSQFVHFSVLLMGIIGSHVDITSGFLRHQARGLEIARVCPTRANHPTTRRRAGDGQESNRPGAVRRGPSQHRGRPSGSGPPGCGACVAIVLGIDFRCQTEV